MRGPRRSGWRLASTRTVVLTCGLAAATAGVATEEPSQVAEPAAAEAALLGIDLLPLTPPNLEHLEAAVAAQIGQSLDLLESLRRDSEVSPQQLAEAFGDTGRLFHAYDIEEQATTCYANAARLAPGDFRWTYYRAVLDQATGRLEAAISGYRRALELAPRYLASLVHLGEAYLAAHRLDEAQAVLEEALELAPSDAAARASLGQIALSKKDYAAAVEHLEAALAATPDANRLHHPLGLAYRGLGEMDKARHHLGLRGKVGVRPADPLIDSLAELKVGERVFLLRGRLAFRSGRYLEAAAAFQAALDAQPESVRARVNLASALAQAGRRDEAIAHFRRALELEPENRAAHFNLGVLLVQAGSHAAAADSLAAAVALDPDDAEASLELARVEGRLGRLEPAVRHAARAVELDPANEDARLLEAQLLVRHGRYAVARQRFEAAHRTMPEAGRTLAAFARFLAACPDLEQRDGRRALEMASRVYRATNNVRDAEIVALALAETGRCEEAADWQRKALEAARQAGAERLARALDETLQLLERRPCRLPGRSGS